MGKSQIYITDKRSPIPKSQTVSKIMSSNKASDTKPEILVRKALIKRHILGYRLHYKKIPGKPDICFISKKIAVFINGCFWHACPFCNLPIPKNNEDFWIKKFKNNRNRDNQKKRELEELGWKVITLWECKIKKEINNQIATVEKALRLI